MTPATAGNLRALCNSLLAQFSGYTEAYLEEAVEAFANTVFGRPFGYGGPKAVLIVDECQMAKPTVLTMLRQIWDRGDAARRTWEVGGPYFPGHEVYAIGCDRRAGRTRIWAGPNSSHFGGLLRSTDDFGRTWTNPEAANVKFPEGSGAALTRIWQIVPGRDSEPDTLYCGVEPAALFASRDAGATWSLVDGLWNHPHRPKWQPGGGGLCLHTIFLDPERPARVHSVPPRGGGDELGHAHSPLGLGLGRGRRRQRDEQSDRRGEAGHLRPPAGSASPREAPAQ